MSNYKHGHAAGGKVSLTYKVWEGMHHRCRHHPEYAGRGVSVDPRWAEFENFLEDMGERPVRMTIERIDNDGNYCKTNCKWATYSEQNFNQRPRRARTTRHGNSVLTDDEVRAIRADTRPQRVIAEAYGYSGHTAIGKIQRRVAYPHVP